MAMITVGHLTLDKGILSGPADCITERGDALVEAILAGQEMIYNTIAHLSPDVDTGILVRLQTDYAGWLGLKQAEGWLKNG